MPRSNWKGSISFGLVNIPIVLFNSQDPSSGVSFKQINKKTGDKIKYKRVDADTEKEVPWDQIGKGYEYEKNVILPVDEKELKRVAGENARTIAIEEFVDKKNINLVNVQKTYYLIPDKKGEKGYVILREVLNKSNKIGIAKVIISTKEYLAAVAPYENALALHLLHYHDELRPLSTFDIPADDLKKYKVSSKEVEIALKLVNSMSAKWKPEKYKDEFKLAVEQWVSEKINDLPETTMPSRSSKQKSTKVIDLVELLRQSLKAKKPAPKSSPKAAKPIRQVKSRSQPRRTAVH